MKVEYTRTGGLAGLRKFIVYNSDFADPSHLEDMQELVAAAIASTLLSKAKPHRHSPDDFSYRIEVPLGKFKLGVTSDGLARTRPMVGLCHAMEQYAKSDGYLKALYCELIIKANPALTKNPNIVKEFASKLTEFTHVWGSNYPDNPGVIAQAEQAVDQWIREHTSHADQGSEPTAAPTE